MKKDMEKLMNQLARKHRKAGWTEHQMASWKRGFYTADRYYSNKRGNDQ